MSLTPDQAAAVARRHKLSLMDAAGLLSLADSPEEADRIAGRFAGTDDSMRELAARLFGRDKTTTEPTTEGPATRPSREGANPTTTDDSNAGMRSFVADLFDRSEP